MSVYKVQNKMLPVNSLFNNPIKYKVINKVKILLYPFHHKEMITDSVKATQFLFAVYPCKLFADSIQ